MWAARLGASFPVGTLIVNLLGCFLIAAIMQLGLTTALVPPTLRLALTTGFLGGLTTYSTFNYETLELVEEHALAPALLNFAFTAAGCFCAGLVGLWAARRLAGG